MADIATLRDDLANVEQLLSGMSDGPGKAIIEKKRERAQKALDDALAEESKVEEVATKPTPKAKAKPKKSAPTKEATGGKALRYIFEKPHGSSTNDEPVIERKVVRATSQEEAEGMLGSEGWEFIKTISRGKSPKEGLISLAKKNGKSKKAQSSKESKAKATPTKGRVSKEDRNDMAKIAGMSESKAKSESDKVTGAKKRSRKKTKNKTFLFEMPMKTKAGKVKRKVVVASSLESAEKSAGKNYTLVRETSPTENPKVGIMDMEDYVAPPKRGRGRPPGSKNKSTAKSQSKVKAKAEAIGEGIAIADKGRDALMAEIAELTRRSEAITERLAEIAEQVRVSTAVEFMGQPKKSTVVVYPIPAYDAFFAMEDDGTLYTRPMMQSEPADFVPPFDLDGDDEWGLVSAAAFNEEEREEFDKIILDEFGIPPKLEDDFGHGGTTHGDVAPKFSHVWDGPLESERFGCHCMIASENGGTTKSLYITPTYEDGSYDSDEWTKASNDWIESADMADDFNDEMADMFGNNYNDVTNKASM